MCKTRELRVVRLKQGRGDTLSHHDLRILLEAREGGDTTEEAHLSRSIDELTAELEAAACEVTNHLLHEHIIGVTGGVKVLDKSKGKIVCVCK